MDASLRAVLERRIKTLEAERFRIEMKIEALQEILGGKDVPIDALTGSGSHRASVTASQANGSSGGLRSRLFSILSTSGPLTRKQAIAKVEESGFRSSGKTPVKVLVTSELYRLRKSGVLAKTPDGQFAVARRA